jgi:hypothetical protein
MVNFKFSSNYDDPAPVSFVAEGALWEKFKSICAQRKQKPSHILNCLMHNYVIAAEEYGI